VCQLLNAVATCSVTELKDAALEYICLNLEGMLENKYVLDALSDFCPALINACSLLEELDGDLMLELNEVVRQNQLNRSPISKSGKVETELLERFPDLVDAIERGKRTRIDQLSRYSLLHEREAKIGGGSKDKAALLEDFEHSQLNHKSRRRPSKGNMSPLTSPSLKARKSTSDLIFEMDHSSESDIDKQPRIPPSRRRRQNAQTKQFVALPPHMLHVDSDDDEEDHEVLASPSSYQAPDRDQGSTSIETPQDGLSLIREVKRPWAASPLATPKLDMKDIMAQTSSYGVSTVASGLAVREKNVEPSGNDIPGKLSQKERKRQQQQLAESPQPKTAPSPSLDAESDQSTAPASPWHVASRGPKLSLKDVLGAESSKSPPVATKPAARTPSPMTLRQTVSGKPPSRRATSGPAQTIGPAQQRSVSSPSITKPLSQTPPTASQSASTANPPIKSVRHTSIPVEPNLQLSMADILNQQQTEKEVIKEAAAKRSLQEIQEEQAFQEWWDQESRKAREEEEEAKRPASRGGKVGRGRGRGDARGRGQGKAGSSNTGEGRGHKTKSEKRVSGRKKEEV